MRNGFDQSLHRTPPPRSGRDGRELGPRRTEIAHESHFLSRALRCEGVDLDRAMRLYHYSQLVRIVLEDLLKDQPKTERVAIPLRETEPTPRVIVTRGGRFITCLDETMACADLPELPYREFSSSIAHVEGRRAALQHQLALLKRYGGKEIGVALFEGPGHLHRDMAQVLIDCEFDRQVCDWLIQNMKFLGRFAQLHERGLLTRRRAIEVTKLEGSTVLLCYVLAGLQSPAVAGILDFYVRRDTGFDIELNVALSRQADGDDRLFAIACDRAVPPPQRAGAAAALSRSIVFHRSRARSIVERILSLPTDDGIPDIEPIRRSAANVASFTDEQLEECLELLGRDEVTPPASPYYLRSPKELCRFALAAQPTLELFAPPEAAREVRAAWDVHVRTREIPPPPPRAPVIRATPRIGRNAHCPCGSGRKHKHCCLNQAEAVPPGP